jgi:outer membrane protein assembly factor BamB
VEVTPIEEVVEVVDVEPVEVVEAHVSPGRTKARTPGGKKNSSQPSKQPKAVRPRHSGVSAKVNPWDSFRILGIGMLLALTVILGIWLGLFFLRGDAKDMLANADETYKQRSYEKAAELYASFTKNFSTDENISFAKVRQVLALVRKDVELASDPNIGLKTVSQLLPTIASEPALSAEQGDLYGALLSLAGKFNDRADRTESVADRKSLMEQMDELLKIINDPQYVGSAQRTAQEQTFLRISEGRERIIRDISREEELVKAIEAINTKLATKDALAAHEIRRELINRYPQLEADDRLNAKVKEATAIQESLVGPGTLNIRLAKEAPASSIGRTFVLGNMSKGTAPALNGRQLFVKVKGSVYGLDGQNGSVLWRQFVGRDFQSEPIRLSETAASDVLVCQPELGRLQRLTGANGTTQWFADLSTPAHQPYVDGENVYVSTLDGTVVNLDAVAGQTKWMLKVPQAISVAPGSGSGKQHLYVAAESSNLYVLSRADGSCKEVHYLGHRSGAIAVPPVLVLGQLFVFENRGDHSLIRVFSTSAQGLELQSTQTPFRMKGNIVVPPQIEGRRVFVISDLGEIAVLDVEPAADKDKVSRFDPVPASFLEPRLSYMATGNNRLWIAESMLIRMDLVVSRGKLERAWVKEDGDKFTSPPQIIGETMVHCRTLRGNSGVRVSAVNSETGDPLWATDLGIPLVAVATSVAGKPDAINSAAMLFTLDPNKAIRESADSNPGESKAQLKFGFPTQLNNELLLINSSTPNQIAVYSAAGPNKMRVLSANFGGSKPSCPPTAVEGKFAIGLENGQIVLIDPSNGAPAATPFQLPMQPGARIGWNQPAYLPDSKTLITANSSQKLIRIGVGNELRSLSEVDLENRLTGPVVSLGNKVFAVEATPAVDNLLQFDSTSLAKGAALPLEGRLVAGPFVADNAIVVQVDGKLQGISADGQKLWTVDFPKSTLLGPPLKSGESLVFLTTSGQVWVIDQGTGAVTASADVGQPLSGTAKVIANNLLVGSDEGAVLLLPIPTTRTIE